MEPLLLVGGGALLAIAYAAYRLGRAANGWPPSVDDTRTRMDDAAERRRAQIERARQRRLNFLGRALQLALVQLPQAADFRRAASWAQKAREVPVSFRQRQFRRFRSRLVHHFAMRLRAGTSAAILTDSLTDLVQHLGVSAFEAEYIHSEASRQRAAPPRTSLTYAQHIQAVHEDHARRVAAIEAVPSLPADIREQMTEAEANRYRDALLAVTEQPMKSPTPS